ncbi:MAG: TonB-dependent receptor [Muribaculaceae bacterium]|nr:TonB-dependent receptor [Muribaculaceae bacterium]
MRLKLFMLLALFASTQLLAQTGVRGVVVDAQSKLPVAGATVILDVQGNSAITGPNGDFIIADAKEGTDNLLILAYGYSDLLQEVSIFTNNVYNIGTVELKPTAFSAVDNYKESTSDMTISESDLEDEEGNTQTVGLLTGSGDNQFYQAASFKFSIMRFRIRGYQNEYSQTYINGVNFNDVARGRFNYSMTGGLNQAFKSKSNFMGVEAASFGFGGLGGATNINTQAKDYAPGFRGSVAYTNGSYKWRGMVTYATGLSATGWALTLSAVVRYADEGIYPGSFYNSWGYFASLQKVFNRHHSLSLTTFGAPTKRASNMATYEEAYELAGSTLYNPAWGWQEGKKRNHRVVESFSPTAILNWIWDINDNAKLNTGVAFQKSFYASSSINWNKAADPKPDYYRYLPSYYTDESTKELYTDLWLNDESHRQMDWDGMYQANYKNNLIADQTGVEHGSTYMVENRHSNQAAWMFNTNLNMRINKALTLQGGLGLNYTNSSYYKTMKDLLGGRYWLDTDPFSERDFSGDNIVTQNNTLDPDRKIFKGDRFGYDYNIYGLKGNFWLQNVWNLPKWDITYSANISYSSFQREGFMLNGRSIEREYLDDEHKVWIYKTDSKGNYINNSYGKGVKHDFVNYAFKAGLTFKLDGRNNFQLHGYYGTHAPLSYNAYVSPRIKDDVITNLKSEKVWSVDLGYNWNYRLFKGNITAFYTDMRDGTERTAFYDDAMNTFVNYALTGVNKVFKGVELGLAFKVTPSVTLSGAATVARYQYKNRPLGTRSVENGLYEDITKTVYLKNYYVGGTPQEAYNVSVNWAAPKRWFFEVSGTYLNRAYVDLTPMRHEQMDDLWTLATDMDDLRSRYAELNTQEKLNDAFVVDCSVGHIIYLNRRASLNLNLSINNLLNNTHIMTGGYQQGRIDTKTLSAKLPNKYYYAQGIKIFLNIGVRF